MFERLMSAWDGEAVVVRRDEPTGAWMFVCVHSTALGPACGGTRMQAYDSPADGLADAMRLAAAMTLKMAAVDLPFGGGKAVIALTRPLAADARPGLMRRYADVVNLLGGNYYTGPDMNTTPADMDIIGERSSYVVCRSEERGGSGDPGPHTATGVFHGIRASVKYRFGSPELAGRTVLVQGVGDVGAALTRQLAAAHAKVLVSDLRTDRVTTLAAETGATVVSPEDVIGTECDVYAPCARGGTLDAGTIPRLRCQVVAGCANNQLAEPDDAQRLHDAGILYAPDFVINAGGVLYAWGRESLGWSPDTIAARLAGIGDTLTEIFASAQAKHITTQAAAGQLAGQRLRAA